MPFNLGSNNRHSNCGGGGNFMKHLPIIIIFWLGLVLYLAFMAVVGAGLVVKDLIYEQF
jgi:hypothetical protein